MRDDHNDRRYGIVHELILDRRSDTYAAPMMVSGPIDLGEVPRLCDPSTCSSCDDD